MCLPTAAAFPVTDLPVITLWVQMYGFMQASMHQGDFFRLICIKKEAQTDRQTKRQTDRRQTDRQTNEKTERQTDRQTNTVF